MQEDQIRDMLAVGRNSVSLDASWGEEDGMCLLDRVEDRHASPEEEAMGRVLGEDLEVVLSGLDAREGEVLRLYFGLGGRERMTLEEIAGVYGLSRERIRQIKQQALRRLRHRARRRRLASYLVVTLVSSCEVDGLLGTERRSSRSEATYRDQAEGRSLDFDTPSATQSALASDGAKLHA